MLGRDIQQPTEHRGQIRAMLAAHGIEPPELSVWAWWKSDAGKALLQALRPDVARGERNGI
jgi:hypothetical protein